MKRLQIVLILTLVTIVIYGLIYVLQVGGPKTLNLMTYVGPGLASTVATLLLFAIWRSYGPREPSRPIWLWLGLGLGLWAIAEWIWSAGSLLYGEDLLGPSIADLPWLLGYPCIVLGLLNQYRLIRPDLKRRPVLPLLIATLILGGAVILLVLAPILVGPAEDPLTQFLDFFYPLGDLAILLSCLTLAFVFEQGLLGKPWRWIVLALLLMTCSDLIYSYTTYYELFQTGGNLLSTVVDLTYFASYALLAFGFYQQWELVAGAPYPSLPEM